MSTINSNPFMSPSLIDSVRTNVDAATPSSCSDGADREAWQLLIDRKLIEWGRAPDQFEDEGVEPPTRDAVQHAIELAVQWRDAGLPAPSSAVPDANGGIVFERREMDVVEVIHIWDDGTVEYRRFRGTRLIERQPL